MSPHILQDRPHLIPRWWVFCDVQFKFGTLKLVLMRVICSLVFGCGLGGLSGNLFEKGEDSEGGWYRRLVEEC